MEYELEDQYDRDHLEEKQKLSEIRHKYDAEQFRRYTEKEQASEKIRDALIARVDKLTTNSDNMSDEEYESEYNSIKEDIEKSDMMDQHKRFLMNSVRDRADAQRFERQVKGIAGKVKAYQKNSDAIVAALEKIELPSEKFKKEDEKRKQELKELVARKEKSTDEEEKRDLSLKISQYIVDNWRDSNSHNNIIAQNVQATSNALKEILGDTGKKVIVVKASKGSVGEKHYKSIADALDGILGKTINVNNPPKIIGRRGRANFGSMKNEIRLESSDSAGVAIHEYTHFLESNNKKMIDNSIAFLEYRTKGEQVQSLRKLTGINYGGGEESKPDKFFNPYCGKMYSMSGQYKNAYATELMSMGVQRLFEDPKGFAKEDREYFDFVIANLRGEL